MNRWEILQEYNDKNTALRFILESSSQVHWARLVVGTSHHHHHHDHTERGCIIVCNMYTQTTVNVKLLFWCERPHTWEQSCLVYIRNTCSIWHFIQFVSIAIIVSLHVTSWSICWLLVHLQFMYFQYNVYLRIVCTFMHTHTHTHAGAPKQS